MNLSRQMNCNESKCDNQMTNEGSLLRLILIKCSFDLYEIISRINTIILFIDDDASIYQRSIKVQQQIK